LVKSFVYIYILAGSHYCHSENGYCYGSQNMLEKLGMLWVHRAGLHCLTLDTGPSPPTGTGGLWVGVLVSKSGGLQVSHCR